jgi:hypothetical protein
MWSSYIFQNLSVYLWKTVQQKLFSASTSYLLRWQPGCGPDGRPKIHGSIPDGGNTFYVFPKASRRNLGPIKPSNLGAELFPRGQCGLCVMLTTHHSYSAVVTEWMEFISTPPMPHGAHRSHYSFTFLRRIFQEVNKEWGDHWWKIWARYRTL